MPAGPEPITATRRPVFVDDEMLDRLDADRIVIDVERTSGFARRRAHTSRKFRKIVRRVQHIEGMSPLMPVNKVVPVRNDVVDRTPALTERNPAVHAPRALRRCFLVLERENEFAVAANPLIDGQHDLGDALQLHESGDLSQESGP